MAKTKPIGVRFDQGLLSVLKEKENIDTPQAVLNFLTEFYNRGRKISEEVEQYKSGKQDHAEFKEKMNPQPKSVTDQYAIELKNACSWSEIDIIVKEFNSDERMSKTDKLFLTEKSKEAKQNNYF